MAKMVDMEMDDESQLGYPTPLAMDNPCYDPRLMISLSTEAMKKLNLNASDAEIGHYITFKIECCVKHKSESEDYSHVALQIEQMGVVHDEDNDGD